MKKSKINDTIIMECNELYDYKVLEINSSFIIVFLNYDNNSNMYLNYVYIDKNDISNSYDFLSNLEINKILIPNIYKLYFLNDINNNKSYITANDQNYGYYLLDYDGKLLRLND